MGIALDHSAIVQSNRVIPGAERQDRRDELAGTFAPGFDHIAFEQLHVFDDIAHPLTAVRRQIVGQIGHHFRRGDLL